MNWKIKAGIVAGIITVLGILGFIIKIQWDANERLKLIETSVVESKDIGKGIIRNQSAYVTKEDLGVFIKDQGVDLGRIKDDLNKLGADVKAANKVVVRTPGFSGTNIASTGTTPNPNPPAVEKGTDPFGFLSATQWQGLTEPFGNGSLVPFGKVGFSAWQQKPWSVEVLPRKYQSTTVLGQDENGRHYAYSKFQIESDGKVYDVPITEAKMVEEVPKSSFHFTPRAYLGLDGGAIVTNEVIAEVTPGLGVSIFSYGRNKLAPVWSFLNVGIGYASQSEDAVLQLAPVNYNIGEHLPLVDNFHIGPSISLDVDGNVGVYMGGRVGL